MSMLPEELPVVLTVFMAMGAWRISLARVLTRRAAAIETLGSATVLCTDKTGTLTENRMSIVELRSGNGETYRTRENSEAKMPASSQTLAEFGLLASAPEPFDPMEKAFHALCREQPGDANRQPHAGWTLAHAYGLRPDLLAVTHVWQPDPGRQQFIVAAKGAPEAIAGLCRLGAAERAALSNPSMPWPPPACGYWASRAANAAAEMAGFSARIRVRVPGTGRPCRSAASERHRGDPRMPVGRHQGGHDHRRLSCDRWRSRIRPASRPARSSPVKNSRSLTRPGWRGAQKRRPSSRGSCRNKSFASSTR